MLKLPPFRFFEDATVFQDDAEFNRFYVIPGFPSIRRDKNKHPVFLLVKYAFSDQSREENPDLPRGGGYLNFDAELSISKARRDHIQGELQKWVDQEWEEMKRRANDPNRKAGHQVEMTANLPNSPISKMWEDGNVGFPGRDQPPPVHDDEVTATLTLPGHDDLEPIDLNAKAPAVVFGEPLWKSGKVRMLAPQAEGLISNRVAEQPAALVGDNVAAFGADLTSDGATFMQRTLLESDGSGGTDLSPIQVVYELTMAARLPPARALIRYNAMDVYRDMQELWHVKDSGSGDDFYTNESMMTTAIKAGLVTVKIDAGGVTDPEMIQLITDQALTTAREIVVDTFTDKIERRDGVPESMADDEVHDVYHAGDDDPAVTIIESENEVFRLKQRSEVSMVDFEQVIELASSIDFTIAPQGTLQPFFADYSPEEMKRFVREIDLEDDFFKTLSLKARAFAKWDEDGVAFVELEVKYEHDGELKTNTFTFTPESNEPQEWDPSLIGNEREYEFRWRVAFEGREPSAWSKWEPSTNRDLNVSIQTPGKINVEVVGAGLDFDTILDAVLVHLRYKDTARDVPLGGTTLVLTQDRRSGTWERMIYAPWDRPIEYAFEYLLQDGSTFRTGWESTEGPQPRMVAGPPQVDVLNINVLPVGVWSDVVQSVVDLVYEDERNDYHQDITFQLKSADAFKQWAVLLRNPDARDFKYKSLTTFKNGDSSESEWLEREGDQTVPVDSGAPPRLQVTIMGRVVDFDATPTVQVVLQHRDPEHGERTKSFTLESTKDEHLWDIPLSDKKHNKYRYQITYFPKDIDPVEKEWITTTSDRIIAPRYEVPQAGARVIPSLVDFTTTPVVEVSLKYHDPQRGVSENETLIFTEKKPQQWFVSVESDAPRTYSVEIRYHLATGDMVEGESKRTDARALVIPRYKPES